MYAEQLASIGQAADAAIEAQALALRNAETERDIAQREAAAAHDALTACQAARLTLEQRVRDLEAAASGVPAGWKVAFEDRFDGSAIDTTKWNVRSDSQANHLGRNEPANATVAGGTARLACTRRATPYVDKNGRSLPYSTAYLDTIGKPGNVARGRWEIRCTLPKAKGAWPAFWLRDASLLGEIDVLEAVINGKGGGKIVFTVHQSTNGDGAKKGFEWAPPAGFDFAAPHTWAVEWDGTTMAWFVDGVRATQVTVAQLPWLATSFGTAGLNIRLNYQAGGSMPNWYGLPMDAASVLPDAFTVDRVRVLTRA